METKTATHSPGPWRVVMGFAGADAGNGGENGYKVDGPRVPDCRSMGSGATRQLAHADAKLIAAAPDLAEALKRIAREPSRGCSATQDIARAELQRAGLEP